MIEMKTLCAALCAATLLLPAAALAGDPDPNSSGEASSPGSKAAAEQNKDAPAPGSKEAAQAQKDAEAATGKAAAGTEAVLDEAVEPAADAVEATTEAADAPAPEVVVQEVEAEGATVEDAAPAEPKPQVHLSIEAGAIWQAGNTKAINATGAAAFSVEHLRNKFAFDFAGSYGRGVVAGSGSDEWVEIAKKVGGAVRYDRFLIPDINSLYVGGGALHDPLAGFLLQARGDVGYSHHLLHSDKHSLLLEGGVNYSRDQYLSVADGGAGGGQNFVGGRIAAAYALAVGEAFGFTQKVEALLGGRNNQDAGEQGFDGKIVSATGISGSFNKVLSVKFGFTLTYDFVPPLRADGTSFEALDTLTSITVVATLL